MVAMRGLALGVLVAGLVLGRAARAQTSPYEPVNYSNASSSTSVAPWQQPNVRWYGGPVLAVDALGYAALGAALLVPDTASATAPLGASIFVLSGPGAHAWRYRWGAAAGSLGLRVGLGLAGFALGGAVACDGDTCSAGPLIGLTALGMVTASAIDAAALSYERLPPSVGVTPTLSVAHDRVVLGAAGTF